SLARAGQRDEPPDPRQIATDAVETFEIVGVRADDFRAAVRDEVAEVVGDQAVVDRHEGAADLRHRVKGLERRVDIRGDVPDAGPLSDSRALQPRRPAIAALAELPVGQSKAAVDDRRTIRVKAPGAPEELERRQRDFHRAGACYTPPPYWRLTIGE